MGDWIDLLSEAVGGRVVACNDEFFAPAANLVRVEPPVWKEGLYTEQGKWMDGWETRRRRTPGHDWCVLALGIPGRIRSVTVDTAHFTGNYPEAVALWGCAGLDEAEPDGGAWTELIPLTHLEGDSVATFDVDDPHRITHLRLDIHPDGGVARLGVYGDPIPGRDLVCGEVDLASGLVGGRGVEASDALYGSVANLVSPGDPRGMWDGWETR
ncbi:MAG: bifunctional allantoicase/OHCU decarboxylase, partial [Acidimicrobiia bacterium]|nr:bifunctional allantoicase/OHCU decarboxylase [Acidimicrobiia bacterium]